MRKRDLERDNWTTGESSINFWRSKFELLKEEYGEDTFLDTSDLDIEETIRQII